LAGLAGNKFLAKIVSILFAGVNYLLQNALNWAKPDTSSCLQSFGILI